MLNKTPSTIQKIKNFLKGDTIVNTSRSLLFSDLSDDSLKLELRNQKKAGMEFYQKKIGSLGSNLPCDQINKIFPFPAKHQTYLPFEVNRSCSHFATASDKEFDEFYLKYKDSPGALFNVSNMAKDLQYCAFQEGFYEANSGNYSSDINAYNSLAFMIFDKLLDAKKRFESNKIQKTSTN